MTATLVGLSVRECGCLLEQPSRSVMVWFRCDAHTDRFTRARAIRIRLRCESCRRRRAIVRVEFADGSRWRVCEWCEPWKGEAP